MDPGTRKGETPAIDGCGKAILGPRHRHFHWHLELHQPRILFLELPLGGNASCELICLWHLCIQSQSIDLLA